MTLDDFIKFMRNKGLFDTFIVEFLFPDGRKERTVVSINDELVVFHDDIIEGEDDSDITVLNFIAIDDIKM